MEKEIKSLIEGNSWRGLMVLGDFNGHLKILENDRLEDANGSMVTRFMDEFNLQLMNADERCRGVYTWGRHNQKSAIDMILVDNVVYGVCGTMVIDEAGDEVTFSDHNMVTLDLKIRERGRVRFGKKGDKENKVT